VIANDVRIEGLRQVAQRTTDLEASIAFYRDTLGLRFIARYDPPGIAFFDLGGTRLFLEPGEASTVLYLHVPDVQAAYQALSARGVTFEGEPQVIFKDEAGTFGPPGESEWMAFFRDPSGNMLALAARA
jgi:catechol 2,3-dioxygenase-like lactoylglutathione lyase family enzyme